MAAETNSEIRRSENEVFCEVCKISLVSYTEKAIKQHLKSRPHKLKVKGLSNPSAAEMEVPGHGETQEEEILAAEVAKVELGLTNMSAKMKSKAVSGKRTGQPPTCGLCALLSFDETTHFHDPVLCDVDSAGIIRSKHLEKDQPNGSSSYDKEVKASEGEKDDCETIQHLDYPSPRRFCHAPPYVASPKKAHLATSGSLPFITTVGGSIPELPTNFRHAASLFCTPGVKRLPNVDWDGKRVCFTSLTQAKRTLYEAAENVNLTMWAAFAFDGVEHPRWWPGSMGLCLQVFLAKSMKWM